MGKDSQIKDAQGETTNWPWWFEQGTKLWIIAKDHASFDKAATLIKQLGGTVGKGIVADDYVDRAILLMQRLSDVEYGEVPRPDLILSLQSERQFTDELAAQIRRSPFENTQIIVWHKMQDPTPSLQSYTRIYIQHIGAKDVADFIRTIARLTAEANEPSHQLGQSKRQTTGPAAVPNHASDEPPQSKRGYYFPVLRMGRWFE